MISIAVLGYGTVGSGVVEVIEKNREVIDRRAGEEIRVKYILDLRDFPGDHPASGGQRPAHTGTGRRTERIPVL